MSGAAAGMHPHPAAAAAARMGAPAGDPAACCSGQGLNGSARSRTWSLRVMSPACCCYTTLRQ